MLPFNRAETNRAQNSINTAALLIGSSPMAQCLTRRENQLKQEDAKHRQSDGSTADTESDISSNQNELQKNVLVDLLDLSLPKRGWNFQSERACDIESHGLFMGLGRNCYNISDGLRPVIILLRCLGFFPAFVKVEKRRSARKAIGQFFLFIWVAVSICANLFFFRINVIMLMLYHEKFGLMHITTVSSITTGVKPFINFFLLLLFLIRYKAHLRMIRMFDTVDLSFRSAFKTSPPVRLYSQVFLVCTLLAVAIPLFYRVFEMLLEDQRLPHPRTTFEWATDFSFIIVPMLTLWNVLPLFLYVLANRIVCYWCRALKKSLKKEHVQRNFSLKFYYEQFLRLTALQKAIGSLFNPVILLSLSWSLSILSLTIYFLTQPTSSLAEPITIEQMASEKSRKLLTERVYLNLGWSAIQILVAILHIIAICLTGLKTNEETRKIVNTVLSIVPDASAEIDRFQISCFVHKMSMQQMYGMSVWRAFPLERTTVFTAISIIVTYSFLLLKLKDNPAVSPISRQMIYVNTSSCLT
ncbi:Egl-47 [Aphelenchoides besseyi]|nr:Egl-47 [Aphelenchoides besseyi]KAI6237563.1 Egl-47 [Aphelenchoides besseyi]